jgi:hypothetical protein
VAVQIQLRNDTAARWASVNPILARGETGVERDTFRFKIGDGSTSWSSLPYAGGSGLSGPSAAGVTGFWMGPTAPPSGAYLWIVTGGSSSGPVSIAAGAAALGLTAIAPAVQNLGSPVAIAAAAVSLGLAAIAPTVTALGGAASLYPPAALIPLAAVAPYKVMRGELSWLDPFTTDTSALYDLLNIAGQPHVAGGLLVANGADNSSASPQAGQLAAQTNGAVKADVRTSSANADVGVFARSPTTSTVSVMSANFIWLRHQATSGDLQLFEYAAGAWNLLGSYAAGLSLNQWNTLTLRFNGSSVTGYLNGVQRITGTTTVTASGRVGMITARSSGSDEVDWDNFAVSSTSTALP